MLRLSEAIRLGSLLHPQAYGHFLGDTTCAFGAALEAIGGLKENDSLPWPDLMGQVATCPVCVQRNSLINIVMHLNDHHHWLRERIADWVEEREIDAEREATETGTAKCSEFEMFTN